MRDVTAAGFCARGARVWLNGRGIDLQSFLKTGIDAEDVLKLNDEFGNRVVAKARERADG